MKKGFSLSEMLITLVIVGILTAVTVPMLTLRKKAGSYDVSLITCIRDQHASNMSSTACIAGEENLRAGTAKSLQTINYFLNTQNSAENLAARQLAYTACGNGGDKACALIVQACQKDYAFCDVSSTSDTYDFRNYLDMLVETSSDSSKFIIADYAKALYNANYANIKTIVNARSCQNGYNIAAYIRGCTVCEGISSSEGPDPTIEADSGYYIESGWTLTDVTINPANTTTYTLASPTSATSTYTITAADTSLSYGSDIFSNGKSWAKTYTDTGSSTTNSSNLATDGTYLYHTYYRGGIVKINMQTGSVESNKVYYSPSVGNGYYNGELIIDGNYIYSVGGIRSNPYLVVHKFNKDDLSIVSGFPVAYTDSPQLGLGLNIKKILMSGNHIYFTGTDVVGSQYPFYGSVNKTTGELEWVKSINIQAGYQWGSDMAMDDSGNLYITFLHKPAGTSNELHIVKINPNNVSSVNDYAHSGVVWSKKVSNSSFFDVSNTSSLYAFNMGVDIESARASNLVLIKNGKLYIATSSKYATEPDSYGNTGIRKVELWKVDLAKADAGNANSIDWVKANSVYYSSNPGSADTIYPSALTTDETNFYILADFTPTSANYRNQIVFALDPDGNLLWQRTFMTSSYQSYSNALIYYDNALYGKMVSSSSSQKPSLFKIGTSGNLAGCGAP